MTALIIILSIIAFFALVLFIPVSLRAYYNGKVKIQLCVLFLKFNLPREKKAKKHKKKKQKTTSPVTKTDHKSLLAKLKEIKEIIPKLFKHITGAVTVKKFDLDIKVATDDPCDTAIAYGAVNAAVSVTLATFEKFIPIKKKNIQVVADYQAEQTEVLLDARVSTYLLKVLICLIRLVSDGVI